MKREEFLKKLKVLLSDIAREDLEQVEEYYQELIYDGLEQGFSEEQVISGFGTPEMVAQRVREEYGGLIPYSAQTKDPGYQASDMVHTIFVEAANVRIRVRTIKTGPIRVLFQPREGCDKVTFTEKDGVFSFVHKMKGLLHLNWLNLFMDFNIIILEIPENFAGQLYIKTSNASIKVSNLNQLTKGEFISNNGKVRVENVRAERLLMQTENGIVSGNHIISDDIHMETCNGAVVGTIIGNKNDYFIESHTVNGFNNLENSMLTGKTKHLVARTANGKIHIDFVQ